MNQISTMQNKPGQYILEFFIFNRNGDCLVHLNLQEDQFIYRNQALQVNNDRKLENRYKLIFGLLFSMKSFVKNLSTNKDNDYFRCYSTANYKLHYAEFLNGLRFVCMTPPMRMDLCQHLKEIYSAYYTTFISKNIMVKKDEQIKNEIFLELVFNYLNNLNQSVN